MNLRSIAILSAGILGVVLLVCCAKNEPANTPVAPAATTVVPAPAYPTRPYFGDTHLHTALSLDARAFGNTLGPEEAYRFARGEEVVSATGQPAKLSRPLDFLVVADHAEALGTMVEVAKGNPAVM